jgi:hypothetical protein
MYLHKHISINNTAIEDFPFQRELSMEAYLVENQDVLSMGNIEGFDDVEILKYEAALIDGRKDKNKNGRIDILAKYSPEYLAIIELKLGELTKGHLSQLESYLKERRQILQNYSDVWDPTVSNQPKWIGIMIGSTIEPDLMVTIRKGYYVDEEVPIAAMTMNRYKDKDGNIYVAADTYFVERITLADETIAVSTQWGLDNITPFIKHCEKMGITIVKE